MNKCHRHPLPSKKSASGPDDDDDDFTLTRSFDKFETASEMNEMYDIMISDMSEKEQTSVEYALQKEEAGRERER